MAEIIVIDTSLDEDLTVFSRYLWEQSIPHRVVKNNHRQWLLVGSPSDAEQVASAYRSKCVGNELPEIKRADQKPISHSGLQLLKTPITVLLVFLSIAGYLLAYFDRSYDFVRILTFYTIDIVGNKPVFSIEIIDSGEYWRLVTPIFLHFGLLHIVFNSLWLWDLGHRFERLKGSSKLFGLVIIIGMGSNLTQYWFAQEGVFGGMSGVIYGLLGYGWVWSRMRPEYSLQIPNSVVYFMLAWLVVCMVGFSEALGTGSVANAAHVGGLLMGVILGYGASIIHRYHEQL